MDDDEDVIEVRGSDGRWWPARSTVPRNFGGPRDVQLIGNDVRWRDVRPENVRFWNEGEERWQSPQAQGPLDYSGYIGAGAGSGPGATGASGWSRAAESLFAASAAAAAEDAKDEGSLQEEKRVTAIDTESSLFIRRSVVEARRRRDEAEANREEREEEWQAIAQEEEMPMAREINAIDRNELNRATAHTDRRSNFVNDIEAVQTANPGMSWHDAIITVRDHPDYRGVENPALGGLTRIIPDMPVPRRGVRQSHSPRHPDSVTSYNEHGVDTDGDGNPNPWGTYINVWHAIGEGRRNLDGHYIAEDADWSVHTGRLQDPDSWGGGPAFIW